MGLVLLTLGNAGSCTSAIASKCRTQYSGSLSIPYTLALISQLFSTPCPSLRPKQHFILLFGPRNVFTGCCVSMTATASTLSGGQARPGQGHFCWPLTLALRARPRSAGQSGQARVNPDPSILSTYKLYYLLLVSVIDKIFC